VLTNTVLEEVSGDNGLTYARYKNTTTGEVTEVKREESFGVFVFAGYSPATEAVKDIIALNEQGYIVTDPSQQTSVAGIYAAGDVCIKPLRQVVTATSDGALAATELEKYVSALHRKTGLRADAPAPKQRKENVTVDTHEPGDTDALFTKEMRQQLDTVFARMERPLLLKLCLDERPVSAELEGFVTALGELSEKLTVEVAERQTAKSDAPCVTVCLEDGTETGLGFHGVPSGHEFTSFVLGLYNAAGPGQTFDEETGRRIASITKPTDIKILVTLSCTMCPDLVVAVQRIAAKNPNVSAHVYDIHHFEDLKNRFKVMSVPCMVVNDRDVFFGKKTIQQVLDLIK
jgi:thioredoxin reductase (NADPH)